MKSSSTKPSETTATSGDSSTLEFRGVSLSLRDNAVLQDLNYQLGSNSLCAILGPNGAGKTTMLRAILGRYPGLSGEILVRGAPLSKESRLQIGYVPQAKLLDRHFPAMGIEVVATGILGKWPWRLKGELRDQALAALELVGAGSLAYRSVSELSGGEMQRIYLARGIVRQPEILLLDEPLTGMDAGGESDFLRFIEDYRAKRKALILMVTHDWSAALHHATTLLVMNRRVFWCGSTKDDHIDTALSQAFGHGAHAHPLFRGGAHHDHEHEHDHEHKQESQ